MKFNLNVREKLTTVANFLSTNATSAVKALQGLGRVKQGGIAVASIALIGGAYKLGVVSKIKARFFAKKDAASEEEAGATKEKKVSLVSRISSRLPTLSFFAKKDAAKADAEEAAKAKAKAKDL